MNALRIFACLFFPILTLSLRASDVPPAGVVMMSPYEVSANSIDFRKWIKVITPHYIVYSDASQTDVFRVIRELEMVQAAAQLFFAREMMNRPPTVVVLPTSGSDWRKIASKGSVDWQVAISTAADQLGSLILVQYDWQIQGLSLLRSTQGRVLADGMNLAGPFWFRRGIGCFFETAEIEDGEVKLGRQNARTFALSANGWMAWPKFFGLTNESREFTRDGASLHQIEGQAAAFAQFTLSNPEPVWIDRFLQWAAMLDTGREPTEEAFKGIFGHTWRSWQVAMENFMQGGRYTVRSIRLPQAYLDLKPTVIDLPLTEMRELFIVSQVLNQKIKASEASLDALLDKGLKTESLRPFLAEACLVHERKEKEREQVRLLVQAGLPDASTYARAAGYLFFHHVPEATLHAVLSPEAVAEIHTLCEKGLRLAPRHREINDLLAWLEAFSPDVNADSVAAIEKIYRRIDGHCSTSSVVMALAVAQWRAGQGEAARGTAQVLLDSPYGDKGDREMATALLTELETKPAP